MNHYQPYATNDDSKKQAKAENSNVIVKIQRNEQTWLKSFQHSTFGSHFLASFKLISKQETIHDPVYIVQMSSCDLGKDYAECFHLRLRIHFTFETTEVKRQY